MNRLATIAAAALAALLLVAARAFRERMADVRLMQLDDEPTDYVPMAAWWGTPHTRGTYSTGVPTIKHAVTWSNGGFTQ